MNRRKVHRLEEFDYGSCGAYFVTICTANRKKLLSDILTNPVGAGVPDRPNTEAPVVGAGVPDRPYVSLSETGKICRRQIDEINRTYDYIQITKYVIMPNHIHMLVEINDKGRSGTPAPTTADRANAALPSLISLFKRFVNRAVGENIWQRSFHDHVIRDERDYLEAWNYIDGNPSKWLEDEYFQK